MQMNQIKSRGRAEEYNYAQRPDGQAISLQSLGMLPRGHTTLFITQWLFLLFRNYVE